MADESPKIDQSTKREKRPMGSVSDQPEPKLIKKIELNDFFYFWLIEDDGSDCRPRKVFKKDVPEEVWSYLLNSKGAVYPYREACEQKLNAVIEWWQTIKPISVTNSAGKLMTDDASEHNIGAIAFYTSY